MTDSLMSEQEEKEAVNKLRAMMASLRETGTSLTNALMLNAAIVGDRLLDEYEGRAFAPVGEPNKPQNMKSASRSSVPTTGETGRDVDAMVAAVRYDLGGDQMRPMVECDEERLRYLFANAGVPAPSEGSGKVTDDRKALLALFEYEQFVCDNLRLFDGQTEGASEELGTARAKLFAALHAEGSGERDWRADYIAVADAIAPNSDGPADLVEKVRNLHADRRAFRALQSPSGERVTEEDWPQREQDIAWLQKKMEEAFEEFDPKDLEYDTHYALVNAERYRRILSALSRPAPAEQLAPKCTCGDKQCCRYCEVEAPRESPSPVPEKK